MGPTVTEGDMGKSVWYLPTRGLVQKVQLLKFAKLGRNRLALIDLGYRHRWVDPGDLLPVED
jgi:hypothetical protein